MQSIYYNVLKRGVRISLRSKVNDSLITGLRIVDSILPVGKGQRQLILGDRYTGKTSIYLSYSFYLFISYIVIAEFTNIPQYLRIKCFIINV